MTTKMLWIAMGCTLALGLGGCASHTDDASEVAATDEDALTAKDYAGKYRAENEDDAQFFENVRVRRVGTKLLLDLDDVTYELAHVKSGAYVFSSGDLSGDCDDPGCAYVSKVSGVLYLKKVGTKQKPSLKLTVREQHPHPEFDGDLEGETTSTLRWSKSS